MESRKYTKKEKELLQKISTELEHERLNPFDTVSSMYLLCIIEVFKKSGFTLDLNIFSETKVMLKEAFSRKKETTCHGLIEQTLKDFF